MSRRSGSATTAVLAPVAVTLLLAGCSSTSSSEPSGSSGPSTQAATSSGSAVGQQAVDALTQATKDAGSDHVALAHVYPQAVISEIRDARGAATMWRTDMGATTSTKIPRPERTPFEGQVPMSASAPADLPLTAAVDQAAAACGEKWRVTVVALPEKHSVASIICGDGTGDAQAKTFLLDGKPLPQVTDRWSETGMRQVLEMAQLVSPKAGVTRIGLDRPDVIDVGIGTVTTPEGKTCPGASVHLPLTPEATTLIGQSPVCSTKRDPSTDVLPFAPSSADAGQVAAAFTKLSGGKVANLDTAALLELHKNKKDGKLHAHGMGSSGGSYGLADVVVGG